LVLQADVAEKLERIAAGLWTIGPRVHSSL
jgi:hypothetical protein